MGLFGFGRKKREAKEARGRDQEEAEDLGAVADRGRRGRVRRRNSAGPQTPAFPPAAVGGV